MTKFPPNRARHDKSTNRAYVRWNNKKTYFGVWGSHEAKRKFLVWYTEATGAKKVRAPADRITVATCVEMYLAFAEGYYSDDGASSQEYRNVCAAMDSIAKYAPGDWYSGDEDDASNFDFADEFGPLRLLEIRDGMVTQKLENGGLRYARRTINAHLNKIRRCFRWCASRELISAMIVTALDTVDGLGIGRSSAKELERVEEVSTAVVMATLPFVSPTVAAMICVQWLCGMRPQDVCRMTTGAINRTGDIWIYQPYKHKTTYLGKSLSKAIPPAAQELLMPYLRENPDEPLFSPRDSLEYWHDLWRTSDAPRTSLKRKRNFYTSASYGKSIVYAIAQADSKNLPKSERIIIPHWAPNQLRHAIATQLRADIGIEAAQLFLGHSKPDTTLIYAAECRAKLIEIARKLVSPFDRPVSPETP